MKTTDVVSICNALIDILVEAEEADIERLNLLKVSCTWSMTNTNKKLPINLHPDHYQRAGRLKLKRHTHLSQLGAKTVAG